MKKWLSFSPKERAHSGAAVTRRYGIPYHQVTIDILSESFTYFERFCGPLPGDMEHEEYFVRSYHVPYEFN